MENTMAPTEQELPERMKDVTLDCAHCEDAECQDCMNIKAENTGWNKCLDQITPIVARLKARIAKLEEINKVANDEIHHLESALKRAEGVSVEEIENVIWENKKKFNSSNLELAQAIHTLLTTRRES